MPAMQRVLKFPLVTKRLNAGSQPNGIFSARLSACGGRTGTALHPSWNDIPENRSVLFGAIRNVRRGLDQGYIELSNNAPSGSWPIRHAECDDGAGGHITDGYQGFFVETRSPLSLTDVPRSYGDDRWTRGSEKRY
jgi:hypothetical protein